MKQIKNSDTVKYIISQEVPVSIEDLTDDVILKLKKTELQIALKAMKKLYIRESSAGDELRSLIIDYDSMAVLLGKNGYVVSQTPKD